MDQLGLINYNARLYDPKIGRFLSADTVTERGFASQNTNRYAYARNNPLTFTDPSGHASCESTNGQVVYTCTEREAIAGFQVAFSASAPIGYSENSNLPGVVGEMERSLGIPTSGDINAMPGMNVNSSYNTINDPLNIGVGSILNNFGNQLNDIDVQLQSFIAINNYRSALDSQVFSGLLNAVDPETGLTGRQSILAANATLQLLANLAEAGPALDVPPYASVLAGPLRSLSVDLKALDSLERSAVLKDLL